MAKSKTKIPNKVPKFSITDILNDLKNFFEDDEYAEYTSFEDDTFQEAEDEQKIYFKGDTDGLARDYFHDSNSLLGNLEQFDTLKNGKVLMHLGYNDENGYNVKVMVGNLESSIPWAIGFSATLGEYNDEDNDLYGEFEFFVGDGADILNNIKQKNKFYVIRGFENLDQELKSSWAIIDEHFSLKEREIEEDLIEAFLATTMGQKMFPLIEKKLLNQSLPEGSTQPKTKKTL